MNFTKVFSLFVLLTLAVLSVSAVSAATLYSDNFDANLILPNGWIASPSTSNGWSVVSGASPVAPSFPNNLETKPASGSGTGAITTSIERTQSTIGNQSIILSYDRNLGDSGTSNALESGDSFKVFWFDGTSFIELSSETINPTTTFTTETTYTPRNNIALPSEANNLVSFKVKFECITNVATEFCRVDNVKLEGTAIPVTPTSTNLSITSPTTPFTLNQNATLTVTNPNALSITMSEIGSTLFGVTFSPLTFSSTTQTVQAILSNLQNIKFGLNTVNVQATAGTQSATSSFQVKKTFCTAGETSNGNITIRNIDWSNEGEGEDNNWELLDEIELEVEVGNSNDDEDVDVIVELGLYDSSGKNIADDLRFSSDSDSDNEEIEININDDDEETVNYKFMVPADFDSGSYKLAVKVYNDDSGESKDCDDSSSDLNNGFFQIIDIKEASDERRFVVVDDFNLDSQFTCGQVVTGQFTIFNIGNKDQDRVKILIQNDELKINEFVEYTSDLDKGEEETLDFTINIPATAKNGIKELKFTTLYDYRNGVYREESEDTFSAFVEVIGCSQNLANPSTSLLTNINIEAELSSEAISGKELLVTSTITNTGTEEKSFSISAQDYSEWAELSSTSNDLISLKAGESKEVTFKFNVNEKTVGAQTFDIQVTSEGKVQVQQVEVNVESNEGFSFDLKGNSTLWIIGLVNAILIILIVVVAIRISKK